MYMCVCVGRLGSSLTKPEPKTTQASEVCIERQGPEGGLRGPAQQKSKRLSKSDAAGGGVNRHFSWVNMGLVIDNICD